MSGSYLTDHDKSIGEYDSEREERDETAQLCEHCGRECESDGGDGWMCECFDG